MTAVLQKDVALAPRTTIGLGGPSRYLLECGSDDDLREGLRFAKSEQLPALVLGGGSNVVFSDRGFSGVTLCVEKSGIEFGAEKDGLVLVQAAAGESWDGLVAACVAQGLAGIECLSGIPGRVGGAPIQNVGAYGQETADVLHSVTVLNEATYRSAALNKADCGFGYRTSRFKEAALGGVPGPGVVTGVTFALRTDGRPVIRYPELARALRDSGLAEKEAGPGALEKVRRAVLLLRTRKAMVYDPAEPNSRSCGSFFTNPVVSAEVAATLKRRFPDLPVFDEPDGRCKLSAAFLVEHGGGFSRGLRRNGVGVSERHSLALVNYAGTTTALVDLAKEIRDVVLDATGVRLVPEPQIFDEQGRLQKL